MPKFMFILHSSPMSDSTSPPSGEVLDMMMDYNEALGAEDMLLQGAGLLPSSQGARIVFGRDAADESHETPVAAGKLAGVEKGPFAPEGRVCGFWIVKARDLEHALEWAKKAPLRDSTVEVRAMVDPAGFDEVATAGFKERSEKLWKEAREREAKMDGRN